MTLNRRQLLLQTGVTAALGTTLSPRVERTALAAATGAAEPFRYCLNTSTIRDCPYQGRKMGIVDFVAVAAQAGYQGIELWTRDIQAYVDQGGSLSELEQRIKSAGLVVENAIGFPRWAAEDPQVRAQGMEEARRDMELVRGVGGQRVAAPPAGVNRERVDLYRVAQRYRELLTMGRELGITAQLEMWGSSLTLGRLGELALVAVESGHPAACMLPDVYHIYKGGSDFTGLRLLNGQAIHVFHMNDYPAEPARDKSTDADRVFPGDGVAPLAEIIGHLYAAGFRGVLSLELFNRGYWQQEALQVARTGLEKMRAAVRQATLREA